MDAEVDAMNTRQKSEVVIVVIVGLLLAVSHLRRPLLMPLAPIDAPITDQTRGGFIRMAQLLSEPHKPARVRGAALRDKGEAMGGGMRDLIDISSATIAAQ